MAADEVTSWANVQLSNFLRMDEESVKDITNYMMSFSNADELKTFVVELLGGAKNIDQLNSRQKSFIRELSIKWQKFLVPNNVTVYRKEDNFNKGTKKNPFDMSNLRTPPVEDGTGKKSKKKSFVSLYGKDGKMKTNTVMIPGRNLCECQAQKHKLVNNCLKCGRVVCEQEGSGPCLFCGELVCTKEEKEILLRKSNRSEKLRNKLEKIPGGSVLTQEAQYSDNVSSALAKARAYKDRLLNYDRTCLQRTKVIDDESDYYAFDTNVWLSESEKKYYKKKEEAIREIRHGSRLNKKFTIDFAGRQIVEDTYDQINVEEDPKFFSDDKEDLSECFSQSQLQENFPDLVNPNVKGKLPVFVPTESESNIPVAKNVWKSAANRLQDKQLLEMSDSGRCLSMHQPWASLLTRGIKKDEGRSWYSSHRGKLWIAAAAKKPSEDEISAIEELHRQFWRATAGEAEMPDFPKDYPISCLLGCVDVKDVLSQEDYTQQYPHGESNSAYVFVCENPHELTIKFPVKGKHKIWNLDPKIHKAAKGALVY